MPTTPASPEPPRPRDRLRLSVVIPVLNEAAEVRAALSSLGSLRQAAAGVAFGGGIELVVADGGSTDTTAALCQGLADQVIHAPRGRARQMNAGAAAAGGEVLLFLHVDTRLPADAFQAIAQAVADPRGPAWGRFDVSIVGQSRWFPVIATMMNWRSALSGIATGDQALFLRREAFEALGGFPDQPLMEDIELCKRARRLGLGRPRRLRERVATSGRRWEARGVWPTIWLMWRLRWCYWRGASPEQLARAYR